MSPSTSPAISTHLGRAVLPEQVHPGDGMLTDKEIKESLKLSMLLRNAEPKNAKYASYELRVGTKVAIILRDTDAEQYQERRLQRDEVIAIEPGQALKVFAEEELDIPANVMAYSFPVGNLYRLGLLPETTYADPGFQGEFWVVVCNYSNRVIEIQQGDPLARIQFLKLRGLPDIVHGGVKSIRKPARIPRRLTPPDLSKKDETQLNEILRSAARLMDSPHYEHIYITGKTRESAADEFQLLKTGIRRLRFLVGALAAFALLLVLFLIWPFFGWLWTQLPVGIQGHVGKEYAGWVINSLIVVASYAFQKVSKRLGKDPLRAALATIGLADARRPGGA